MRKDVPFPNILSHDPGVECTEFITASREVPQEQSQDPESLSRTGQSSHVQMW